MFLVSTVSFAEPTLQDASLFIAEQLNQPQSALNQKMKALKSTVKPPGQTVFISEPAVFLEKPPQNYEDCYQSKCHLYQRKIFSKISSFRTNYQVNQNHSIWIQWLEIVVSLRMTWTLDSQKKPVELIEDRFVFEGVYFVH
jgi:hypothetical protein